MKNVLTMIVMFAMTITFTHAEIPPALKIGDAAPNMDQSLLDISGVELTLDQVKGKNGLLVIFTCNSCPFVLAWEDRYPAIAEFCDENEIGLVMVNSNEARRHTSDSYDNMKSHAEEKSYNFYYAVDANHELADAMGATKTPDVFLFDESLHLMYKGAIDDNHQDAAAVKTKYLDNALVNMLKGVEIDPNSTKSIGCTIKRVQ